MEKLKIVKFVLLAAGTVLFTLLFWKEGLGINTFIFSVFILGIMFYLFPESKKSAPAVLVSTGILIGSGLIVYHASGLAVFIWIVSLFFLPAFAQNPKLKTLIYGFFLSLFSYVLVPGTLANNFKSENTKKKRKNKFWRMLKLTIVPLIVLFVFYWIFKLANPIFDKFTDSFFQKLNDLLIRFFKNFSILKILFIFWGFTVLGWFIYKAAFPQLMEKESKKKDKIIRIRKSLKKSDFGYISNLSVRLKNEYRSALILVVMVNLLLLIINIIDINSVWLNFKYSSDMNLTQFVHEGTYLLILSILLSMAIMMYYFRKNQNFYPKRSVLQKVTYFWIFQNAVLLISVWFRNLHYIYYFGLAYKRIGLFFFLTMVAICLITLVIKIRNQKTSYYLLKTNIMALYIGFIVFAVPDWDTIITTYNIAYCDNSKLDISFLINMDGKVYPILEKNKNLFENKTFFSDDFFAKAEKADSVYETKKNEYLKVEKTNSWLSWNYSDWKSTEYLKK
jgi:hypothetical protein